MKKKVLHRIIFWLTASIAVLLVVLFTHIFIVTHKPKTDADTRQLSRIDFKQPLDSMEAGRIRDFVAGMDGVENAYFNLSQGTLVFIYTTNKQSSENIYNELKQFKHYKAEKYSVNEDAASMGCPAMGPPDSFKARLTTFIANL
jgi:hypothetical protein